MQVPEDDLASVMTGLTATANVDGILVTMPHKFAAFPYCTTSSTTASLLKVVSIIRRNSDGTWHGDMLDGRAFVKAQIDHGAQPVGARALLLGAGGAGGAIAIALLEAGVRELIIHDPDTARVDTLIDLSQVSVMGAWSPVRPILPAVTWSATRPPSGMEDGDPLPVDPELPTRSMFVGDVIAGHGVTPFLQAAQMAGCHTANGGHMVEAAQDVMAHFLLHNGDNRS